MPPKKIARKVAQIVKISPLEKTEKKVEIDEAFEGEKLDEEIDSKMDDKRRRKTPKAKKSDVTATRGDRKRKRVSSGTKVPAETEKSNRRSRKCRLLFTDYLLGTVGNRVLSCGEGEQLGHPYRRTTKKPRAIDEFPEDARIVQVVAGGVHSLVLFEDGTIFTCGINEKGTAPGEGVEAEGSSDRFARIIFSDEISENGKIIMITAGASFSAALTEKGSVIAWGSIRDTSGCIESHKILLEMEKNPIVVIKYQHKVIVKIAAGENHLVMLSQFGELLTFGDGSMGQLGRSVRVGKIRSQHMVDDTGGSLLVSVMDKGRKNLIFFDDIMAGGYWTAAKSLDGRFFVCGLNNFGQLGIEPPDLNQSAQPGMENEAELKIMRITESPMFSSHKLRNLSGVQHIIAHDESGNVYGIGKNIDNAIGLGTWNNGDESQDHWRYTQLKKISIPGKVVGVSAKLCSSVVWTKEGKAYSWGFDSSGQLGLGIKDEDEEKLVSKPKEITSAHLDDYRIICGSIADNHTLFLATNNEGFNN